jgi:RNA polymerase sigma factor (sigma-70 family)
VEDLEILIDRIRDGHSECYEPIIHRFQNMAVGCGYAILGDFQLAEDAAQEAFIAAYFELPDLREPKAFPGWFRRILIKQIDRVGRRKDGDLAFDEQLAISSSQPTPMELVERQEIQAAVWTAIQSLPLAQREVVTLFYMGGYSHKEISVFLAVPISTVKMRLYHARKLLQQQLVALIEDALPRQSPSRNHVFMEKIMSYKVEVKHLPAQKVISMMRNVFHKELQGHLDTSIKALMSYAQEHDLSIAGLPMALYHGAVREDQAAPVEVCLPVGGDIQSSGEIQAKELAATQAAFAVITLRQSMFPGVLKAYDAIEDWLQDHQYQAGDAPREIYLNFNTSIFSPSASLDDPCIEIAWPYRGGDRIK